MLSAQKSVPFLMNDSLLHKKISRLSIFYGKNDYLCTLKLKRPLSGDMKSQDFKL